MGICMMDKLSQIDNKVKISTMTRSTEQIFLSNIVTPFSVTLAVITALPAFIPLTTPLLSTIAIPCYFCIVASKYLLLLLGMV